MPEQTPTAGRPSGSTSSRRLETAQKLYQNRLRPHLTAEYDVSDDDLERARRGEQLDRALAGRVRSRFGIT